MQKQAPTIGKLAMIAVFALSCFLILTYLWTSFGGPTPISAKGYRFQADFKEATQLADNADVRISGVTVGHVKKSEQVDETTRVEIEVEARYAPIPQDTRATLRQKTLLGETYVELTPGSGDGAELPDGGQLSATQVKPTVELDEILRALDKPTRDDLQRFLKGTARAFAGRGEDVNAAVGQPVAVRRGRRRPGTGARFAEAAPFASSRPTAARCSSRSAAARASCRARPRARRAARRDRAPQRRAGGDRPDPADDAARAAPDAWPSSRSFRARRARWCVTCAPPRARSSRRCRTRFRWRRSCAACSATSTA